MLPPPLLLLLIFTASITVDATIKYNQRTFLNVKAINFVDPTKHGFRIILTEEFLQNHMAPILLPTLYVSAIPLRGGNEPTVSRVFYPDSVQEDRQVNISDLKERSWYYVCIEWENFNRHNETTGTDCRIYRTLDRFGKGADSTVSEVEATDVSSQMFMFRLRSAVDFPIRISAFLEKGKVAAPPAQVFLLSETSDLDVVFPFLRQQKNYGQLCVLEEPLTTGCFTAMGRIIQGISIRKCYFSNLTTNDYELSIIDSEASPYRRSSSSIDTSSTMVLIWMLMLAVAVCIKS